MPATSATGERTFSAARRLMTWLRATMGQQRFNSVAILNWNKSKTAKIPVKLIAEQFVNKNENRKKIFGSFND